MGLAMDGKLREISVAELRINPMSLISEEWMLITAGTKESGFNTMTAGWGQMGAVWGHGLPTTTVFVRPQRDTKVFIDREDFYTLSFFPQAYKKQLIYLGTHSGRDENKIAKTGLTPVFKDKYTWFAEAKLVLVCRKLYRSSLLQECFLDQKIMDENYPKRDFHDLYIGELVKVLCKEEGIE